MRQAVLLYYFGPGMWDMRQLAGEARSSQAGVTSGQPTVLLISAFDLGHQPFGLASPAAWLAAAGARVKCLDLAVRMLDEDAVRAADVVAFYLPMHTATRILCGVVPRVKALNPTAHLCAYVIYDRIKAELLRPLPVASIIGRESAPPLVSLITELGSREVDPRLVISLGRQDLLLPDRG